MSNLPNTRNMAAVLALVISGAAVDSGCATHREAAANGECDKQQLAEIGDEAVADQATTGEKKKIGVIDSRACGTEAMTYDAPDDGLGATAEALQTPVLRFDGLYQSTAHQVSGKVYWNYLRFYADKTVIEVSSTGTPANLASWFNKNNQNVPTGIWSAQNTDLSFNATDHWGGGTVAYQGTIGVDMLNLQIHSLTNGNLSADLYLFVHMTFQ